LSRAPGAIISYCFTAKNIIERSYQKNGLGKGDKMAILSLTTENFEEKLAQAGKPVLVDFWAEWCGPCKMIAPSLAEIAVELADKVQIAKVNIDESPELAAQYGVRSIPTLLMFKKGEVTANMVGAAPKNRLLDWLKKAL